MKNLLTYIPEPFKNLEFENFESAPLDGEMENERGFANRKKIRRQGVARAKAMSPRRITSAMRKPGRIFSTPRLPQIPPRQPMRPLLLPPRIGAAVSLNVFPPPADDRRPSGQSSSSGNAGGEGSFANAPAQDFSSEHVRWVQETLNRALGLRLIVDGIMNRETRSAVRMFQERKGLPVTGLVGPDTEEALRAEGGQAAAEPEQLEGEWEMPDSGECSCGWREMEELVFEVEPFGEAEFEELEREAEYSTPPVAAPRVLTYTAKDVIDKRISVPAQHSLVRLSKNPLSCRGTPDSELGLGACQRPDRANNKRFSGIR